MSLLTTAVMAAGDAAAVVSGSDLGKILLANGPVASVLGFFCWKESKRADAERAACAAIVAKFMDEAIPTMVASTQATARVVSALDKRADG